MVRLVPCKLLSTYQGNIFDLLDTSFTILQFVSICWHRFTEGAIQFWQLLISFICCRFWLTGTLLKHCKITLLHSHETLQTGVVLQMCKNLDGENLANFGTQVVNVINFWQYQSFPWQLYFYSNPIWLYKMLTNKLILLTGY